MNCKCQNMNDRYLSKIDPAAIAKGVAFVSGVASPLVQQQQDLQWSQPECGKRPFFIGRRRNEWNECNAKQIKAGQMPVNVVSPDATEPSWFEKNKNNLIIGGAVIAAGAILFTLMRK